MSIAVKFAAVTRQYGSVLAVNDVSFQIAEGEFFSMLGPSGSGKTTCLRMMAGFEQPSTGDIELFGVSSAGIPPYERAVNTVFQDYALFPHMSVLENVAYGLVVKGTAKKEAHLRAEEALSMVALAGYGARKPSALSGGQRQRVALARALVNRPKVLLLDEPLGALDLKLREHMQAELKRLHQQLGITFVYVTHDQSEALSMSDRVAVFNHGKIEQIDTPRAIYNTPKTAFVANFVGTANVFSSERASQLLGSPTHGFSIRPEYIAISGASLTSNDQTVAVHGVVSAIHFQGAQTKIEVSLDTASATENSMHAVISNTWQDQPALPNVGQQITLSWQKQHMVWLTE